MRVTGPKRVETRYGVRFYEDRQAVAAATEDKPSEYRQVSPGVRLASQVRGKMRDLERVVNACVERARAASAGNALAERALLAKQHRRELIARLAVLSQALEESIQALSGDVLNREEAVNRPQTPSGVGSPTLPITAS